MRLCQIFMYNWKHLFMGTGCFVAYVDSRVMTQVPTKFYGLLGAALIIGTFGVSGIFIVILAAVCFLCSFLYVVYQNGIVRSSEIEKEFKFVTKDHRLSAGLKSLLENVERFNDKSAYDQVHSMTGYASMDNELEQILSYVLRDYVDTWYKSISNDELFRESLKRTSRRSISALAQSLKQVDWVPFLTRHVVDDFASHLRLFRTATEKLERQKATGVESDSGTCKEEELVSVFFDFELEMEKTLCRDLLSTTPHYENSYLHDLVDIILYLIMPPEDFRCRPLRFLVREVIVKCLIVPLLDHFSEPSEMNQIVVWLLSEVSPRPEDFVQCLENSTSIEELEAVFRSIMHEKTILRGKDSGGEQGVFVKQQLGSLDFVEATIKRKMAFIANRTADPAFDAMSHLNGSDDNLVQLPIHVVLTNSVAVSYFSDFLQTVGGQNYIDCYLAIEGFKVSVEHQLRSLANGESVDQEVYETIKEAAQFMYQQYLSQEAITRVPLDETIITKFLARLRNDEPSDYWFEQIQEKIVDVLKNDEHFYPEFKRNALYAKMLVELGIVDEDIRSETPLSDSSALSGLSGTPSSNCLAPDPSVLKQLGEQIINDGEPVTSAVVETLGIGQQGKQSFALYNVRVSKSINGKKISSWNVLRRYSDFHTLHTLIIQKFPKLAALSFPGKKTFNNLDSHFLERRTKALNQFMEAVLQPSLVRAHPELDKILFDFLSQKEYVGTKEPLGKKMMSAMFDPIKMGVKVMGNTVMAVPEQMFDGVSKIGSGINTATRNIIQPLNGSPRVPVIETDRVAAAITDEESTSDSIPLRVLVLFVDEVFGVRARNVWFRRQMMTILRQFVTPFGTSLNKRIIDMVNWLTCEQQVTMYLAAMRESFWPFGQPATEATPRSADMQQRTRLLAKSLMLSVLPDELRLILGADTTYQGVNTISEALQNKQLNRRLLYVLLERLLITVFPQNRFEKIFAQLHSKSPRSRRL